MLYNYTLISKLHLIKLNVQCCTIMLQNVFNIVYDARENFMESHYYDFESNNKDLLTKLCKFLQLFGQTITRLSDEAEPTLHVTKTPRIF